MKKALTLVLAAVMLTAAIPLTVSAYDAAKIPDIETELKSQKNLAYGKSVITSENAITAGSWAPANITDGSLNYISDGTDAGETEGYHSQHHSFGGSDSKNHEEWVGINFGEKTTFDTLVVYPSQSASYRNLTEAYTFPNAFRVDVSNDGENWYTLTITVNGDEENAAQTIYDFDPPAAEAVTINFPAVEAQYVRFVGVSLNYLYEGYYMKLSEIAVYYKEYVPASYETYENVVAGKTATVSIGSAHEDATSNWHASNLNNGNRYDMVTYTGNNDYGQFAGFHSMPAQQTELAIDFTLGKGTTLNQIVIYPSTEKYSGNGQKMTESGLVANSASNFYFPANFTFQISDDGETWTTVKTVTGYSVTEYAPQVFNLDKVYTATYLRFSMTNLTDYIKLSELEAYDTTTKVTVNPSAITTVENTNIALGATVIYSNVINSGGWNAANLNNGELEKNGGFTTTAGDTGTALWVGYDFGTIMKINTVKLASSASDEDEDAGWSGIPKNFEIQVSSNGFNWTTVKTVNNTEVPEYLTLYTYNFDTIAARYIRIVSIQNYEKGSDGNKSYIQLAEMEVSYVPTEADANSEVPTPPIPGQKEDSPKTGDATTVLVFVAMITGLSSVVIIVKRRKYNP